MAQTPILLREATAEPIPVITALGIQFSITMTAIPKGTVTGLDIF